MTGRELPRRGSLIGVGVSITDYAEVTRCVIDAARERRALKVTACAVHTLMAAREDPTFAAVLNGFDVVAPDGQPVRWGLRWTGQAHLPERVYGPALMLEVCRAAAAASLPIYLYGARADVLGPLSDSLRQEAPGLSIAGARPGRFRPLDRDERERDGDEIERSGARIVFVGMGSPRQEWWIFHMRRLALPMLAVGAAFDFHAGVVAQAPAWMQRRGLEWLFRLSREPRRLWRRYLLTTPRYLPLVAAQALRLRQFPEPTDLDGAGDRPCPG
jgi:exopolysaccharide biosynthesis WecB/TagA/CpsF family protein